MLLPPKTKPRTKGARTVYRDGQTVWPERYPDGAVVRPGDARGASELAAAGRELMPPALYVAWLLELAAGRDPAATLDEHGARRPEADVRSYVPPDYATRRWALETLGNRNWGKEKQVIELEGELHHTGAVAHVQFDAAELVEALSDLAPEEREAVRAADRLFVEAARRKLAAG